MNMPSEPSSPVTAGLPDLSNSPDATPLETIDRVPGEGDTCRICRSEGTPSEPLFYPCKCSGSIKFVHQDCLMEWLSHSNKKYCELCKTPFRFTKLYDSHMPNTLPMRVFAKRAALHTLRYFLTWARGLAVALVWLVILPWCIRWSWRGMFWLLDIGWARDVWLAKEDNMIASSSLPGSLQETADPSLSDILRHGGSPESSSDVSKFGSLNPWQLFGHFKGAR